MGATVNKGCCNALAGGGGGDKHVKYTQGIALDEWTITHGLMKFPSVTIVDNAGSEIEACVTHVDENNLIINFSVPIAGCAYLN